tara:strand:+ start:856 stop:1146 length:291 start_codon:yes stop_codon:yes gene_type:complete
MKGNNDMNLSEIKGGILTLDNDGLNEIISTINFRRREISQRIKNQFKVGDRVWFNGRRNKRVEGTIDKINRKNIVVKEDNGWTSWNVSPSLLKELT